MSVICLEPLLELIHEEISLVLVDFHISYGVHRLQVRLDIHDNVRPGLFVHIWRSILQIASANAEMVVVLCRLALISLLFLAHYHLKTAVIVLRWSRYNRLGNLTTHIFRGFHTAYEN